MLLVYGHTAPAGCERFLLDLPAAQGAATLPELDARFSQVLDERSRPSDQWRPPALGRSRHSCIAWQYPWRRGSDLVPESWS